MSLVERIGSPADLKALPVEDLPQLSADIRAFLVDNVARTGGHLGPNLGVVELTIAIHRVFDSPRDTIVFDTGHQSYVHKILTGRRDFTTLRRGGGLSGYPDRSESDHDVVENSHASTSLSWAHGIASGRRVRGQGNRHTVAVIGDGALTGGMAWEALNNIAAEPDLPLVIVVNDNERSYSPTRGGLADHLATLRLTQGYERFLDWGRSTITRAPVLGSQMYDALHGMKKGLKDFVAPQGLFEDLGLKYLGPVDGHDVESVENALEKAKSFGGPVLVHVLTQKGRGYDPAVNDANDQFHAVGVINPETGLPLEIAGRSWTDEFADAMVALGGERDDVVAVTAAMMLPVGLEPFHSRFPGRTFDVGIAEQHALTMAAGLAFTGLHPVVAVYATFLNRAFDQLLMDCALHRAGVTVVLDRAGVTGPDGPSHHGMWDLSITGMIPGLHLAAPRDGQHVASALRDAVAISDAPSVIRFPKGSVGDPIEAVRVIEGMDVVAEADSADVDVLIVGIGSMVDTAIEVSALLAQGGIRSRVIDPVWALPLNPELLNLAASARRVAVIEDNITVGGIGSQISYEATKSNVGAPVDIFGLPDDFIDHGTRSDILESVGLTGPAIASAIASALASQTLGAP